MLKVDKFLLKKRGFSEFAIGVIEDLEVANYIILSLEKEWIYIKVGNELDLHTNDVSKVDGYLRFCTTGCETPRKAFWEE